jgi:cell division transport system permease protein
MQKRSSKKKLGSYPYMGVVISITLALFVTGLFGMLIIYSQQLELMVRENVKMQVYLKSGITDSQRLQLEKRLESLPYIDKSAMASGSLVFVSKEEAAKKFIEETGEDFTKFLGDNPLHDVYLVKVATSYHAADSMKKIKTEIEKIGGVFQVFYVEGLIDSINKNVTRIGIFLAVLIAAMLASVVVLINNTIRLALFSQRFLIRSMQLVGARNSFIQRPFLLRSLTFGALGAVIAALMIWGGMNYVNSKVEDLALLQNNEMIFLLFGFLLVVGVLVTLVSTYISMRRYLRMSLDDLY